MWGDIMGLNNTKKLVDKKAKRTYERIRGLIIHNTNKNIIIAYSGGKDSTLILHFILRVLKNNLKHIKTQIHLVYSDTGVEIPMYSQYVYTFLDQLGLWSKREKMENVLRISIVKPLPTESFWYYLFVKGYPTPTYLFRWCTRRLKTNPMKRYILQNTPAIVILGVRHNESSNRNKSLNKRRLSKLWSSYDGITGVKAFLPIIDWNEDEVIEYLKSTTSPWGSSYERLLELYEKANPCDSIQNNCKLPRFGCWVCTVIRNDRTLEGLAKNGYPLAQELYEFKQYLMNETRKPENRIKLSDGRYSKVKPEIREKLFWEFIEFSQKVKYKYNIEIISNEEIKFITNELKKLNFGE